MPAQTEITALLRSWRAGEEKALERLTDAVYPELHRIARGAFHREKSGHTLQPTALINEAFLKLVDVSVDWQDRAHFFALAARMMRRILVNHAEARNARKRGGDERHVTLTDSVADMAMPDQRIQELDEAIEQLAALDARKAELVELQIFGGLTFEEMAELTHLSTSTIDRELRFAKSWLKQKLSG